MTPEQRKKDNARSYANVYLRRGKIEEKPCKIAGCRQKPQMHHPDYNNPTEIEWLCRQHHLELHAEERRKELNKFV